MNPYKYILTDKAIAELNKEKYEVQPQTLQPTPKQTIDSDYVVMYSTNEDDDSDYVNDLMRRAAEYDLSDEVDYDLELELDEFWTAEGGDDNEEDGDNENV
jgi:hypothetical protein